MLVFLISACNLTIELGPSKDPQPKPAPDDFPAGPQQHRTLAEVIKTQYGVELQQAVVVKKLPAVTNTAFYRGDKWKTYLQCLRENFSEIGVYLNTGSEWLCKASLEDYDTKRWFLTMDPSNLLYYYDYTQGVLFEDTPEGRQWAVDMAHNMSAYQAQGVGAPIELPGLDTPISIARGYDFEPSKIVAAVYDAREYHHGRTFVNFIKRYRAVDGHIFLGVAPYDWCLDPMAVVCPDPTPWLSPRSKKSTLSSVFVPQLVQK
jgi:hypothetical protein